MAYKENREVTVYSTYNKNQEKEYAVPQIRFQGKWLEELGFEIGDRINICCEGGRLTITRADEVIGDG